MTGGFWTWPTDRYSDLCNRTLRALEGPIEFASRDDWRRLPQLRNFEDFARPKLTAALEVETELLPGEAWTLRELLRALEGFDRLEPEQRRERLEAMVERLQAPAKPASEAQPDAPAAPPTAPQSNLKLDSSVQYLPGVGPKRAGLLARLGIQTVEDLLFGLPRRYRDRRNVARIKDLTPGDNATVIARVVERGEVFYRRRGKRFYNVIVRDDSGSLTLKWFNFHRRSLEFRFAEGRWMLITGKVSMYRTQREIHHPIAEPLGETPETVESSDPIQPVYGLPPGLFEAPHRKAVRHALDTCAAQLTEVLPPALRQRHALPPLSEALARIHFPDAQADLDAYTEGRSLDHRRLIYEEFLLLQLAILARRERDQALELPVSALKVADEEWAQWQTELPFELTSAQQRTIAEIRGDMGQTRRMRRLLQGDVGSGKTVVAWLAARLAIDAGRQAAIMAPTEILAEQHARTLEPLAKAAGIELILLLGSMREADKRRARHAIAGGHIPLIVGTHALIQEAVDFHNLGLVVVDEQHRFGVVQRAVLGEKGEAHQLIMTATPIPRTLAMTVYGDLHTSVLDERPPGRKPVKTKLFGEEQRERVYERVRRHLADGRQAYFVYPLVAESDAIEARDATTMAAELAQVFQGATTGLLHGQLDSAEKVQVMERFKRGEIQLLIATTVIEVGVDVPNATVMVIEHAERYGLAQLHQLRGRVGRGAGASECLLVMGGEASEQASERLKVMTQTDDGFKIAEADLEIRGFGDLLGRKQSGLPELRFANVVRDQPILMLARDDAQELLAADPDLERHPELRDAVERRFEGFRFAKVG